MWIRLEKTFYSSKEFLSKFKLYFDSEDTKNIVYYILENSSSISVKVEPPFYFFDLNLYDSHEELYEKYEKIISDIREKISNEPNYKSILSTITDFFFDKLIEYRFNEFIIEVDTDLNEKDINSNDPDLIIFYKILQNKPIDFYYKIHFTNCIPIKDHNFFMRATAYPNKNDPPLVLPPFKIPAINLTKVKLVNRDVEKAYRLLEDLIDYASLLSL